MKDFEHNSIKIPVQCDLAKTEFALFGNSFSRKDAEWAKHAENLKKTTIQIIMRMPIRVCYKFQKWLLKNKCWNTR